MGAGPGLEEEEEGRKEEGSYAGNICISPWNVCTRTYVQPDLAPNNPDQLDLKWEANQRTDDTKVAQKPCYNNDGIHRGCHVCIEQNPLSLSLPPSSSQPSVVSYTGKPTISDSPLFFFLLSLKVIYALLAAIIIVTRRRPAENGANKRRLHGIRFPSFLWLFH